MRPYCVLLLALVFLATFSNVVSEDTPATAQSLTTFTNVAKAEKAAEKVVAAEAAKVAKTLEKLKAAEDKDKALFASLLKRMVDPEKVSERLGLTKLGPRAKESRYFDMFMDYGKLYAQRAQRWS
ncbi:hypothetical protein JM18_009838 [Phytophthora kernoviae]|uniref:RxLR effector protein n=1 Tax=Phytophthora kernoviae TaxID=325452 RepID=A0A921SA73_9STRA|nr:hypothetical protein JM18_009838 [Phytophthora kernoviae]